MEGKITISIDDFDALRENSKNLKELLDAGITLEKWNKAKAEIEYLKDADNRPSDEQISSAFTILVRAYHAHTPSNTPEIKMMLQNIGVQIVSREDEVFGSERFSIRKIPKE